MDKTEFKQLIENLETDKESLEKFLDILISTHQILEKQKEQALKFYDTGFWDS